MSNKSILLQKLIFWTKIGPGLNVHLLNAWSNFYEFYIWVIRTTVVIDKMLDGTVVVGRGTQPGMHNRVE